MLFSKQRGGCQQHHLFAIHHADKRGPQCHFGFSKTHIAAHQAVHGAGRSHVCNHSANGSGLVCGFFKSEFFNKGFIVANAQFEFMAFSQGAAGVQVQQFGCGVAHHFCSLLFGLFPLA